MRDALVVAVVSAFEVPAWSVYEGDGLLPGVGGGVTVFAFLVCAAAVLERVTR